MRPSPIFIEFQFQASYYGKFAKQIPSILFIVRCLIFLFVVIFLWLERLGQRISQTARDSRKIPTHPQSAMRGQYKFIFFPKNVASSPRLSVNDTVSFLKKNYSANFRELFADYDQGIRVLQNVCDTNGGYHTIKSPFSRWTMCHVEKQNKR